MQFRVRKAKITDIPAVYSSELAYIREREPAQEERWINAIPRHLHQWIINLPRLFVAVQGPETIGHCFWQEEGEDAVLASLCVAPAWRRQGCGLQLLRRFERDAAKRGFTHLALGVHKNNPAHFLYHRAGFQPTHSSGSYDYYEKWVLPQNA